KRINQVCLTDTARNMENKTMQLANETMQEALKGIAADDIETVKKVLYQVYENLHPEQAL
ncbi:MAG TPA: MarR family transcriptional regulator, partial [Chitinophagaceae bacterium]|nr:MarR family transcriptional regulator [Chitinophagaceae bacterium]